MNLTGKPLEQSGEEDALYYKALLSSIDDALISTDKNFRITSWNKAAENIYNIKAEDALGKTSVELFNYEFLDSNREQAANDLIKTDLWKGTLKLQRNDGKIIVLQSSVTAVKNAEGESIGYVGVNRDITEAFESRNTLQKLTALLSSLQESFYIVDRDLKIIFVQAKGDIGSLERYKVGDSGMLYVFEHRKQFVHECYLKAFNGEPISYEQFRNETDGQNIWLHFTYFPLKDSFGAVTNVFIVVKNITAQKEFEILDAHRKESERKFLESKMLFENFMENSPLTAWITHENGNVIYMNPPYLKIFGFTKKDVGQNLYELFPKNLADQFFANNQKVIETDVLVETIEKSIKSDGSSATYHVYKFPLRYNESVMIAGWAVDVTDEMKHREELVELNKYKDKIVSVIAHDLKNYFTINYTTTEYLLGDHSNISTEELHNFLQILHTNNIKTLEFLDDLSQWVKSTVNKLVFTPKKISLKNEVENVLQFLHEQLDEKNISIKLLYNASNEAFADEHTLQAIIRNLLSNAIKFSPPGSEITIKTEPDKNFIVLSMTDKGVGMSKDAIEKIMSSVNYESTAGTKGEKGMGVGLNLTKSFIEKNGGKMWIESAPAHGSTFYFTIPSTQ
jgi:PAS domain S-box-containing protein